MCIRCFQISWSDCPEEAARFSAFWATDEADEGEADAALNATESERPAESDLIRTFDRVSDELSSIRQSRTSREHARDGGVARRAESTDA